MKRRSTSSEEEPGYITVVDVRDYAYCPNIVYFTKVLHIKERVTEAMEYGKEQHEKPSLAPIMPRLKPAKIMEAVELRSNKLKLVGKVDYVILTRHGEYIPVEVKWSDPEVRGGPKRHHKIQLAAYALLLEEHFKTTVKRALIYYSRAHRLIELPLSNADKREAKEILGKIRKLIKNESFPEVRRKGYCDACGYRVLCQGGFMKSFSCKKL